MTPDAALGPPHVRDEWASGDRAGGTCQFAGSVGCGGQGVPSGRLTRVASGARGAFAGRPDGAPPACRRSSATRQAAIRCQPSAPGPDRGPTVGTRRDTRRASAAAADDRARPLRCASGPARPDPRAPAPSGRSPRACENLRTVLRRRRRSERCRSVGRVGGRCGWRAAGGRGTGTRGGGGEP